MSDVNGGRVDAVMQLAQLAAHQPAELGIERAQGLVHEKRLGSTHDSATQGDALPVAAGEPADPTVQEMIYPQQPCHFLDASPDLGARVILAPQRKGNILAHVHVRVERK